LCPFPAKASPFYVITTQPRLRLLAQPFSMEESVELQQLISAVVHSEGKDVDKHFNRYKSIVRSKCNIN
jgi:hypothetical protein